MITYTNRQKKFLKQVSTMVPLGTRTKFYNLVKQQLGDDTAPDDITIANAAFHALHRHSTARCRDDLLQQQIAPIT
jgi:hypothetical protein